MLLVASSKKKCTVFSPTPAELSVQARDFLSLITAVTFACHFQSHEVYCLFLLRNLISSE